MTASKLDGTSDVHGVGAAVRPLPTRRRRPHINCAYLDSSGVDAGSGAMAFELDGVDPGPNDPTAIVRLATSLASACLHATFEAASIEFLMRLTKSGRIVRITLSLSNRLANLIHSVNRHEGHRSSLVVPKALLAESPRLRRGCPVALRQTHPFRRITPVFTFPNG